MISKQDIESVALNARLELDEDEKELYAKQLNDILNHAQDLEKINTEDVPPTVHILPIKNVFREDVVGEHLPNEKAIANAPEAEGNFFKVPKIL